MNAETFYRVESAVAVFFGVAFTGFFAWFPFRGVDSVPLWGPQGLVVDLVPTVFMLVFMTTAIITFRCRRAVGRGGLQPFQTAALSQAPLPRNFLLRALTCGILCTVVLVPLGVGAFLLLGIQQLPWLTFFVYKLVFGGLLALLVAPPLIRLALTEPWR